MKTNYPALIQRLKQDRATPHECDFLLAVCKVADNLAFRLRAAQSDNELFPEGHTEQTTKAISKALEAYDKL